MSAVVSACARAFCLFSRPAEEEEEEREKCRRWRDSIEGIDRAQSFLQSSTSRASPCSVFLPVCVLPHGSHSHAEAHCVLESPPKTQTKTQNSQEETAEAVAALSVGEEEAAAAGASAGAPGGSDAASGSAKPKKEKPKKEKKEKPPQGGKKQVCKGEERGKRAREKILLFSTSPRPRETQKNGKKTRTKNTQPAPPPPRARRRRPSSASRRPRPPTSQTGTPRRSWPPRWFPTTTSAGATS